MNRNFFILVLSFLLLGNLSVYSATRRALIIGLGKQEDVRWGKIHGDNDVLYVRQMLLRMGYTDIRTLTNEQATKQAMVNAFIDLALRCEHGDEVYIHYSGHGQLMTDLDGDEALKWNNSHADWDEAWIPYDAYMTYGVEDRGEKHFCDDEVAFFLRAIRKRIGRRGSIVVAVDACHSGDATAATDEEMECIRGVDMKFCIPRNPSATSIRTASPEEWRTISACKPNQLASEIRERQVGKLTFALYAMDALNFELDNEQLERLLSESVEQYRGRVRQNPMVSGKK